MLEVHNLRCEYKNNPIGIDVRNPRISWVIRSDERVEEYSKLYTNILDAFRKKFVTPNGRLAVHDLVDDGVKLEMGSGEYIFLLT
jgi:predicted rRNA methylase YqxC with S4 and FtsJ domains